MIDSAMADGSGTDRAQLLLLPEAVDDYVGPDNPVRFIEAFEDGPDLTAAGFVRVAAKKTGRRGYDPADLLKLYATIGCRRRAWQMRLTFVTLCIFAPRELCEPLNPP